MEVMDLVEGVPISRLEVEDLTTGEEVGFAVEDMPSVSGGDDDELMKIVLVKREKWLRRSRLYHHELRLPAEELMFPELQHDSPPE
jgi:hypothetical protein